MFCCRVSSSSDPEIVIRSAMHWMHMYFRPPMCPTLIALKMHVLYRSSKDSPGATQVMGILGTEGTSPPATQHLGCWRRGPSKASRVFQFSGRSARQVAKRCRLYTFCYPVHIRSVQHQVVELADPLNSIFASALQTRTRQRSPRALQELVQKISAPLRSS